MRFNRLQEWLEWQENLHTNKIDMGLERVGAVWARLHPDPFPTIVITVGGTNGKGSSIAFLDAILRAAGYRTGCFTSPHLLRYNERIRIDGVEADDQVIMQAFDHVERVRGEVPLTYFEISTLAALDIFTQEPLDVVILEVGLGGRLDAVNILDADAALITTIDIDHTDWLGETREAIGYEKAGIMRAGRPAVYAGDSPPKSLVTRANEIHTRLFIAGKAFSFQIEERGWQWRSANQIRTCLPMPNLTGRFQLQNASAVLMLLELLQASLPVDLESIKYGLENNKIKGRFQVIHDKPKVILDVAHNPEAAQALVQNLKSMYCAGRTSAVFSMLANKDISQVAKILAPVIDHWYLGELNTSRAAATEMLCNGVMAAGVASDKIRLGGNLQSTLIAAIEELSEEDRLVVFGSFYTVGTVLGLAGSLFDG